MAKKRPAETEFRDEPEGPEPPVSAPTPPPAGGDHEDLEDLARQLGDLPEPPGARAQLEAVFRAQGHAAAEAAARKLLQEALANQRARDAQAAPAPAPAAPAGRPGTYRVRLPMTRVLVKCPVKEVPLYQPHLDVAVAAEDLAAAGGSAHVAALRKFAAYNGIPTAKDPMTGAEKLASVHTPSVEFLE